MTDKTIPSYEVGDEVLFQDRRHSTWNSPVTKTVSRVGRKWFYVVHNGIEIPIHRKTGMGKDKGYGYGNYERVVTQEILEIETRVKEAREILREGGINTTGHTWPDERIIALAEWLQANPSENFS